MAKKLYKPASMGGCEHFVDDSSDVVLEGFYKVKPFCAVLRPEYSLSITLINCINEFYRCGGFGKIIKKMQDKENLIPINILS